MNTAYKITMPIPPLALRPNESTYENQTDNPGLPITKKRTREKAGDDASMRAQLERHDGDAAMGACRKEKTDRGRILVCVTSVRRRLLDEDNLCEKLVVDCCRYSGLIPGDSAGEAKIETMQRKVVKAEEPHTIVEITIPDEITIPEEAE